MPSPIPCIPDIRLQLLPVCTNFPRVGLPIASEALRTENPKLGVVLHIHLENIDFTQDGTIQFIEEIVFT